MLLTCVSGQKGVMRHVHVGEVRDMSVLSLQVCPLQVMSYSCELINSARGLVGVLVLCASRHDASMYQLDHSIASMGYVYPYEHESIMETGCKRK